jgi:hypothetical protein
MGYLKAAKCFALPERTLKRFPKDKSRICEEPRIFPNEYEKEFTQYRTDMGKRSCGLRSKHIRNIAFHLAVRNG